jgi:TDG/mug DNA glycosylase family protein
MPPAYSPDVLTAGLDVVFCGINPATTAVADGHNFSNRSNRFWTVLHRAGFTDVRLAPADEQRLLEYGCGITAVVTRATQRAADVSRTEFALAVPVFEAKMRTYAPRALAFLDKRAYAGITDGAAVSWGLQTRQIAGCDNWVLPNPSGLNRGYSTEALVDAYAELRRWLDSPV